MNINQRDAGHMAKVAAMLIYGINPFNIISI